MWMSRTNFWNKRRRTWNLKYRIFFDISSTLWVFGKVLFAFKFFFFARQTILQFSFSGNYQEMKVLWMLWKNFVKARKSLLKALPAMELLLNLKVNKRAYHFDYSIWRKLRKVWWKLSQKTNQRRPCPLKNKLKM